MITGYLGTDKNIVVPDTLYGCPVTAMEMEDDDKNLNTEYITYVKFPTNLKYIHETVFEGYGRHEAAVETIVLPEGLETIHNYAFSDCANLKNINIPSTVKKIGEWAFEKTAIESIKLPTGVETIGAHAFTDCKSLKSIEIPEGIKQIGMQCFMRSGLVNVNIPYVEQMGAGLFYECADLQRVTIAPGYKIISTNAYYMGLFQDCVSLKEVSVPNTVEVIGEDCFRGCKSLSDYSSYIFEKNRRKSF